MSSVSYNSIQVELEPGGPPAWKREGRGRCRVHRQATCLLVPEQVPGTTRTATKDRDPPCATAQFGRCTRLGGDGRRRTQSTIGTSVWRMPSSGTRQPQGRPLERAVLLCSTLPPLLSVTCSVDVSASQARIVHRQRATGLWVETPAHHCHSVPRRSERECVGQHGGEPRNMSP